MPGNQRAIVAEAELKFPVRIVIKVPGDGIGTRYKPIVRYVRASADRERVVAVVLPETSRAGPVLICYCGGRSGCAITGQSMIAWVGRRPPT